MIVRIYEEILPLLFLVESKVETSGNSAGMRREL